MKSDRKYIAVSIKHTRSRERPVLWGGNGRSPNNAKRCFSGYTCNIDEAELYSVEEFQSAYGNGVIKCDEPVPMKFDYLKKYKKYDTVLIDEAELRNFISFL